MNDISVLMTVYNGMPYLPLAVASVLRQTFRAFCFVIVDDGSTDGTAEYIKKISDPRVMVIRQDNHGTAHAANHGLEYCHTQFVARIDSDDVSLPTRLERQRDFLIQHPDVGLVGTQLAPLGQKGTGGSVKMPIDHDEIMAALMAGRHGLAHSCIMMRTGLLKQIGGYWQFRLNDAWDMMLRMGEVSRLANINEVLHHYRIHTGSLNGAAMRRMRFSIAFACELARRRQAGEPAVSPEEFQAQLNGRSWWWKALEAADLHARCQYRLALAELLGDSRIRGALRMAWAATCSPQLTIERIGRMIRYSDADASRTSGQPQSRPNDESKQAINSQNRAKLTNPRVQI
jgi:glycosyltransferase involved in cell wall biosynthesis